MVERILNVNRIDFGKGGVPVIAWRWGLAIDKNKYVFDYLGWDLKEESEYTKVIYDLGGKVYSYKDNSPEVIKEIRQAGFLKELVKRKNYNIVHIQGSNTLSQFLYARASKKAGAKKIIVHAHSANVTHPGTIARVLKRISHELFKEFIPLYATDYLACSKDAGKWCYPSRVHSKIKVINNGIDIDKFSFNPAMRNSLREELWHDKNVFVIGHVGRLSYQKNHSFLIDVFDKLYRRYSNMRLLLIGLGELEEEVHKKIECLGLKKVVTHIRFTPDVNNYMQAMDAFLLPSVYEGLGIVVIEAQASGLPVIMSSNTPREAIISDLVQTCPINQGEAIWVDAVENAMRRKVQRSKYADIAKQSGFSIQESARNLEKLYAWNDQ